MCWEGAGGSGKQVFGDAWYLDLEGDAGDPQSLSLGSSEAGSSPRSHVAPAMAWQRGPAYPSHPQQPQGAWWAGEQQPPVSTCIILIIPKEQLCVHVAGAQHESPQHAAKLGLDLCGGPAVGSCIAYACCCFAI